MNTVTHNLAMKPVEPIVVTDLFPELLDALLGVLRGLSFDEWQRPTACDGWTVHDVALHLFGGDIGLLSRRRDGYTFGLVKANDWGELVAAINQLNDAWLHGARRISPHLLCDLLRLASDQVNAYFRTLDLHAMGGPVSWAGPEPAPVWLDLAREYTERWHHQQHIRDALGKPGMTEPRYLSPALDAFVRALPHTFREVTSPEGTEITFVTLGIASGTWVLRRESGRWVLFAGQAEHPAASVSLPQDAAWRLFTKGLRPQQAQSQAVIAGDQALGLTVLDTVSLIA
jgi:uncharacterized protein (TIGR03083 family)